MYIVTRMLDNCLSNIMYVPICELSEQEAGINGTLLYRNSHPSYVHDTTLNLGICKFHQVNRGGVGLIRYVEVVGSSPIKAAPPPPLFH